MKSKINRRITKMSRKRTDVEKIREILRLSLDLKYSIRKTADMLKVSKTSVGEYLADLEHYE